jgi:cell division protein FtsL
VTKFHTVKRIDNSRLARPIAAGRFREMARLIGLGSLLAAAALFYAWQHFQYLQLRYQIESLKAQRSQFSELNQELKLEVAGLRAPSRIDEIARRQLRLTAPVPGQVAPLEGPYEPVVAQVRPSGPIRTQ